MYLDAHNIKLCYVTENALYNVVNGVSNVFLRNIHSDERFIGTPKEVLYLDVGIAKKIQICGKMSTFFGIKSQEMFLPKCNRLRMHIENATVLLRREKNVVFIYANLKNYTLLEPCH